MPEKDTSVKCPPSESSAWRIFLRWYMMPNTKIVPPHKKDLKKHLRYRDRHGRQMENMVRQLGKYLETHGTASFWERAEAPLPPPRPKCNFIQPCPIDEILSRGYCPTTWVKTDPDATLHVLSLQISNIYAKKEVLPRSSSSPSVLS